MPAPPPESDPAIVRTFFGVSSAHGQSSPAYAISQNAYSYRATWLKMTWKSEIRDGTYSLAFTCDSRNLTNGPRLASVWMSIHCWYMPPKRVA